MGQVMVGALEKERTGIESDFHSANLNGERLSPEIEIAVFRIAPEGLNNVLKHAEASRVSTILERRDRFLRLVLENDGAGFDVERHLASPEKFRHLGLRGMRERVARLGGSMEIESSPGNGTTLFVRIPDPIAQETMQEETSGE